MHRVYTDTETDQNLLQQMCCGHKGFVCKLPRRVFFPLLEQTYPSVSHDNDTREKTGKEAHSSALRRHLSVNLHRQMSNHILFFCSPLIICRIL